MKFLLSLLLIATGALHLFKTSLYATAVPAYLPFPETLVVVSGLISVLLGILLIFAKTTRPAAWLIAAYFLAVFPANIHMALNPGLFPSLPAWGLWLRLPLQPALIFWAYRLTQD